MPQCLPLHKTSHLSTVNAHLVLVMDETPCVACIWSNPIYSEAQPTLLTRRNPRTPGLAQCTAMPTAGAATRCVACDKDIIQERRPRHIGSKCSAGNVHCGSSCKATTGAGQRFSAVFWHRKGFQHLRHQCMCPFLAAVRLAKWGLCPRKYHWQMEAPGGA